MSGPKVVNLEALRRRQQRDSLARLRELQDLVGEWQSAMERAGLFTDDLATQTGLMFGRLENLRQSEQWAALLAELPARRDFFRHGIANARQTGIKRVATLRERSRRLELAAAMLQREWLAGGSPAPAELEEVIRAGNTTDETELARLEAIIQTAFSQLPKSSANADAASVQQRELAEALQSDSASPRTFHEWLAARAGEDAPQQARNDRLDRALAELELHASASLSAPLFEKARLIAAETEADRRALLTDSLLIEADALCRSVREREETSRLLREHLAALEPFQSTEAEAWRQRLTAAQDNPSPAAARELAAAAQAWLSAEAAREDAIVRRQTVLKALAALGYEVREGMATAWAENGRVVVRKPSEPNYGVELASPPTGAAVQARVVAFDVAGRSSLSAQRDREVEHTWCSEFQRMRELLEADGFTPTLQHAIPAGEMPVKVVPQSEGEHRDLRNAPTALDQKRGFPGRRQE